MSHPNEALANLVQAAFQPAVDRMLEPMPDWMLALLPEDRDCPYPLQGGVNVPLPFEEDE